MSLWWAEHAVELPAWAQLAARVFMVSPTSAAVERVFSILRDSFHHGQNGALEDYVESSLCTTTGLALAFRSASAMQRLLHSGAAARWRENRP